MGIRRNLKPHVACCILQQVSSTPVCAYAQLLRGCTLDLQFSITTNARISNCNACVATLYFCAIFMSLVPHGTATPLRCARLPSVGSMADCHHALTMHMPNTHLVFDGN